MEAHDAIIANRIQQTFHANKKHRTSDLYHVGDHMYLSTQNLTLPTVGNKTIWMFGGFGLCIEYVFWLNG